MSSVDERVVDMRFNNGEFEKGIKESMKSLEDLKRALELDKQTESLNNLDKAVSSMDFQQMSDNVQKLTDKFSLLGMVGMKAMNDIANKVVNTAEHIAKSLTLDQISAGKIKYEQKTEAVQAILAATEYDMTSVEEVLERLNWYTDWTSYNFTDMAKTIGQFTSSGIDLYVAEQAMEGIGNAAGLAGASVQNASHAMYNFAQALSSGAVRLQDWKSIEIANMATQQFKEVIIDTAIELGTLSKAGEHVGKTAKGTTVDFQTFRSTLQEAWFTSDVLTESLMKFADQESELGKKGFEAASITISLSQALTTIKDTVSSGWMKTFELIFGNFEEASELFSNVTDAVLEAITPIAEWRNGILEAWRALEGREVLIEGLSNLFGGLWNIVIALKDAFWQIFPDTLVEDLSSFTIWIYNAGQALKSTFGMIDIEEISEDILDLKNNVSLFTAIDSADAVATWADSVANTLDKTGKKYEELEKLAQDVTYGMANDDVKRMQEWLMQAGYALDNYGADGVYGPETQAALKKFQEDSGLVADGIFGPKSFAAMQQILGAVTSTVAEAEQGSNTISVMTSGLAKLQSVARGVFSIFHIGWKIAGFGLGVVQRVLSALAPLGMVVLSIAAVVGDFIAVMEQLIDQSGIFEYALDGVEAILSPLANAIARVSYWLVDLLDIADSAVLSIPEIFAVLMDNFKNSSFFAYLVEKWNGITKTVGEVMHVFGLLKKAIFDDDFADAAKGHEWLGPIVGTILLIKEKVNEAIGSIKSFFSTFDYSGAGQLLLESFSVVLSVVAAAVMSLASVVISSTPYIVAGFEYIKAKAIELYNGIVEYFSNNETVKNIVDFFEALLPKSFSKGKEEMTYFERMVALLQEFEAQILKMSASVPEKLSKFIGQVKSGFKSLFAAIFKGEYYNPGKANEWLNPIITGIRKFRIDIKSTIEKIKNFGQTVGKIFGQIKDALLDGKEVKADQEWLQPILDKLVEIHGKISPVIESIKSFFALFSSNGNEVPEGESVSFFDKLLNWIDIIKEKIAGVIEAFGNDFSIENIYNTVKEWVHQIWTGFVDAIKEYFFGEGDKQSRSYVVLGEFASNNVMSDIGTGLISGEDSDILSEKVKEWILSRLNTLGETIRNSLASFGSTITSWIPEEWRRGFSMLRSALFSGEYETDENTPAGLIVWLDRLVAIHDFIEKHVKPVLQPIISFITNAATLLWGAIETLVNPSKGQNMPWAKQGSSKDNGKDSASLLNSRLDGFVYIAGKIKEKIQQFLKSFDFSWLESTMKFIGIHFRSLITTFAGLIGWFAGAKLVNALANLSNSLNPNYETAVTKFLKFAGALALIAASMFVLSKISVTDLAKGLSVMGLLMLAFRRLSTDTKVFSKGNFFKGFTSFVDSIGNTALKLAGSVALLVSLAFAIGLLMSIPYGAEIFNKGALVLIKMAGGLAAFTLILAGISKLTSTGAGKRAMDISKLASAVLKMSLAIGILAGLAAAIGWFVSNTKRGAMFDKGVDTIIGFAVGMVGFIGALALIAKLTSSNKEGLKTMDKVTKQLIVCVGAIVVLAGAAAALGFIPATSLWSGIGAITVLTVLVGGLTVLLSKINSGEFAETMKKSGSAIVLLAAIVGALYILMGKLESLGSIDSNTLNGISILTGTIGGVLAILSYVASAIGAADFTTVLKGAAALVVVGAALALVVDLFASLGITSAENISLVLGDMSKAISDFNSKMANVDFGDDGKLKQALTFLTDFADWAFTKGNLISSNKLLGLTTGIWSLSWALSKVYDRLPDNIGDLYPIIQGTIEQFETLMSAYGTDDMAKKAEVVAGNIGIVSGAIGTYFDTLKQANSDASTSGAELDESTTTKIAEVFSEIAKNLPSDEDLQSVSELAEESGSKKGRNLSLFASGITNLKTAISSWGNMSEDLDSDKIDASIGFVQQIADIERDLNRTNSIWPWAAENSTNLATFATRIGLLGEGISGFANSVGGIGPIGLIKVKFGVKILQEFTDVYNSIGKAGGIFDAFTGTSSLGASGLSSRIEDFGKSLGSFANNVGGLGSDGLDKMSLGVSIIGELASIYNSIGKAGGVLDWIVGDKSIGNRKFAEAMGNLGHGLMMYNAWISTQSGWGNAAESVKPLAALADIYSSIQGAGSAFEDWLFGAASITTFADNMAELGKGMAAYNKEIKGEEFGDNLDDSTKFLTALAAALGPFSLSLGGEPLARIGVELEKLAHSMMRAMKILNGEAVTGMDVGYGEDFVGDKIGEILGHVQAIVDLENDFDINNFTSALTAIAGDVQAFYGALVTDVNADKGMTMVDSIASMIEAANQVVAGEYEPAVSLGRNILMHIANGMYYKAQEIMPARMGQIATMLNDAIPGSADTFNTVGGGILTGIAQGIQNNIDILSQALTNALETAINTIDMLSLSTESDGVTSKFTITPVVDLTNVRESAATIHDLLLGGDFSLGSSTLASQIVVATDNSNVVAAIDALSARVTNMAAAMSNLRVVMDSGAIVGAIAPGIDRYLGQVIMLKGRRS